jgi:3-dehydrotetronate 4-kinase
MTAPMLGCIADDYTGATDLCSMLVRSGLSVVLCFGVPENTESLKDVDAVVIALKSRSIAPQDAVAQSLAALNFLQTIGAERFFFKYCSTFDSTPQGNIGPVADALSDALNVDRVIFCPAFPENGRTVYMGWLFVGAMPLHESSMKDHPLNPMTDSNLVRWLTKQSVRPVHRLAFGEASFSAGQGNYIADAITDSDLRRVAELAHDHRLLTGGSAIAKHWADVLLSHRPPCIGEQFNSIARSNADRAVILAGSCSAATQVQVREFETSHPVYHVDVTNGQSLDEIASDVVAWCQAHWNGTSATGQPLLICSGANPDRVAAARALFGETKSAQMTEQLFSMIAQQLVERGVSRLIVAGGETSGAVMNALKIQSVRIGKEITPGVPWVTSLQPPYLGIALKSGNFGGPRFFFDALEAAT